MRSSRAPVSLNSARCFSANFKKRIPIIAFLVCAALLTAGCSTPAGYGSGPAPTPPKDVAITTQPANLAVPIGRPATFTVAATGTAPIYYEWLKNGVPIDGANSSSYTTPNITLADSGSTYQVIVSNLTSSARSSTATVTAGPRAPAIGDLRYLLFEQIPIPSPGFMQHGTKDNIIPGVYSYYTNYIGTPLTLGTSSACGPTDCAYNYVAYNLPAGMTGLTMYYSEGSYSSMNSDLQSLNARGNIVIISLDAEPQVGTIAAAWVQTQAGGFDYRMETVPQSQLATTVAADGAASRVVTALGLDASTGMADVISYSWQGDTTTAYETTAQIVSPPNIASAARAMADQGYIISAFGGNDTNGYALVGMRVTGDTMPRPVGISGSGSDIWANNPNSAYPTTLVYFEGPPQVPYLIVEEE